MFRGIFEVLMKILPNLISFPLIPLKLEWNKNLRAMREKFEKN